MNLKERESDFLKKSNKNLDVSGFLNEQTMCY